jgi:xanthine/CO dehydrogenase XdhC/CoxF family maturation factor|nr:XdhC family protein [Kofleriaceae bacterium]
MMERAIVEAVAQLRASGEPYVTATVVRVRGSAYRRPGARMVIARDRWVAGSVSGGCLEGDLARTAWWRADAAAGAPVVVAYDARLPSDGDGVDIADDDGLREELRAAFGVGCDGVVEVMIEPAPPPGALDPIAFAGDCARAERRGAIATVFASADARVAAGARLARVAGEPVFGDALPDDVAWAITRALDAAIARGTSATVDTGDLQVLVEALVPPPWLFVFGTGHDAVPLVAQARALGWRVATCTPQQRVFARARFLDVDELVTGSPADAAARLDRCDRAYAVVMNHDYALDRTCLGALLGSRARYIGMLGPRGRTARLLNELGRDGAGDARIHAPVGLDLEAETPAEVALAIAAEVQAAVASVDTAASLSDRIGPIHGRDAAAPQPPPDIQPRSKIDAAIAAIQAVVDDDTADFQLQLDEVA